MIESLLAEKKWSDILSYIENPDEYLSDFEKQVLSLMAKLNLDQTVSVDEVKALLDASPLTRLLSRFDVYGTLSLVIQKHNNVEDLSDDVIESILSVILKESPSLETKLIALNYFIDSFSDDVSALCDFDSTYNLQNLINQALESTNQSLVNYAQKIKSVLEVVCNNSTST